MYAQAGLVFFLLSKTLLDAIKSKNATAIWSHSGFNTLHGHSKSNNQQYKTPALARL